MTNFKSELWFDISMEKQSREPRPHLYDNKIFPQPKDQNVRLWRYMPFDIFKLMLRDKGLWLSPLHVFQDQYEGKAPPQVELLTRKWFESVGSEYKADEWRQIQDERRRSTYASCWHLNDREFTRMWAEHCPAVEGKYSGIAVETSYKKIYDFCWYGDPECPEKFFPTMINYVDWSSAKYPIGNQFFFTIHKDDHFLYENEVRIVTRDQIDLPGLIMQIDLDNIIENIVIHPLASKEVIIEISDYLLDNFPSLLSRLNRSLLGGLVGPRDFELRN